MDNAPLIDFNYTYRPASRLSVDFVAQAIWLFGGTYK